MKNFNTLILSGIMSLTFIAYSTPAYSADNDRYMLVQQSNLHPTKSEDFKDAWKTVLKHAKKHEYKYTTYVSKSGPRVSMATEMSSYADIDAVMADRNRVYEAGGREFEQAIKGLDAATHSESSFVVKHLPKISNPPSGEEMQSISMFELSEINVEPGSSEKFMKIMGKYKAGLEKAGLAESSKYNIYAGGVGARASYYFQSFADDKLDMAQQDAKVDSMFKDSKAMQDLFADFQSIERPGSYSNSSDWNMSKEMAYWPAE